MQPFAAYQGCTEPAPVRILVPMHNYLYRTKLRWSLNRLTLPDGALVR